MTASDKKILKIMPKLNTQRVDLLLEDVLGCRWTISVLRAVGSGVNRGSRYDIDRFPFDSNYAVLRRYFWLRRPVRMSA